MPARSLNTKPRTLPPWIRSWDPTQHRALQPLPSPSQAERALRHGRRIQRERLHKRNKSPFIVFVKGRIPAYIEKLDKLFAHAYSTGENEGNLRERLWKAYSSARQKSSWQDAALTDRSRHLLSTLRPAASRIRYPLVHQDLERARSKPSEIHLLKRMILDGKASDALKRWEQDHLGGNSTSRDGYMFDHLELGVKLYALTGDADRARETMEELLGLYPNCDLTTMMHVFRVHAETDSERHQEEAWNIYKRMREHSKVQPTLEQYDAWFVGFLRAGHLNHAKSVFQDMVDAKLFDVSLAGGVVEALRRLHLLSRLGTDITKMSEIYSAALDVMPESFHPHIYLNWMSSAVSFDAPDHISVILGMMVEQGHEPETEHFNLLMRALFRTCEQPRINKAEDLGWRMIAEVGKGQPKPDEDMSTVKKIVKSLSKRQDVESATHNYETAKTLPAGDATTFTLVMQHHADKDQWEHVDYLARRLNESEIVPNTDLMNILMANYTRKSKFVEAWQTYHDLTNAPDGEHGVFPNGVSIRFTWRNLRLAYGAHSAEQNPALPTPRQLLAETVRWWKSCRSRPDADRFLAGLASENKTAIVNLVLHCFFYTQDFAGALVALHVLKEHFNIPPMAETAELLQQQAAYVDLHGETGGPSQPQRSQRGSYQKSLTQMSQIYQILGDERWQRMGYSSDDESIWDLDPKILEERELNLLSEFIRVIFKRSYEPDMVETMIAEAKEDIGVPDLSTGDLDAFSVA